MSHGFWNNESYGKHKVTLEQRETDKFKNS